MKNLLIILFLIFTLTSCATIVNDANVPVAISFSDGSSGTCNLTNKRGSWSGKMPQTFQLDESQSYSVKLTTMKI